MTRSSKVQFPPVCVVGPAGSAGAAELVVPFLDLRASTHPLDDELDDLWRRVTRSSSFIGGAEVDAFERAWAATCATPHAVGVANGTEALELALTALGVGPGDEVIVPATTFIATPEAVVATGAVPVFADVDDDTLLLTPESVQRVVTSRTAAIVVVHLYGHAADMGVLTALARHRGVALVEDCAQAHGARWEDRPVGSFGDAGCFSFYPGKNLGAFGDAGAVVTSDEALGRRVRQLADHGRSAASRYEHDVVGRNSRLDALQAGVLRLKLPHLAQWNDARRAAHGWYMEHLDEHPGVRLLRPHARALSSHHLEVVRVQERDRVLRALRASGIDASVHYPVPCHLNRGYTRFAQGALPVAERAASQLLSLPLFPGISRAQVAQVCEALVVAVEAHGSPPRAEQRDSRPSSPRRPLNTSEGRR